MSAEETEDDEYQEWDSGPYCRHWADPSDCEECREVKACCGHEVRVHGDLDEGCSECDCKERHWP